jgi:hypothetical protein
MRQPPDGIPRGLLGYFINSNIENQYEFVLGEWFKDRPQESPESCRHLNQSETRPHPGGTPCKQPCFRKALCNKAQTLPQRVVMRASSRHWRISGSSSSVMLAVSIDTSGLCFGPPGVGKSSPRSATARNEMIGKIDSWTVEQSPQPCSIRSLHAFGHELTLDQSPASLARWGLIDDSLGAHTIV